MTRRGGWPPSGFGERLRRVREQAGLSQRELAEKAGCNVFTVAKTERGEQEPAWPLVLALARALGVEVGAFVNDSPPSTGPQPERKPGRPRKKTSQARGPGEGAGPAGREMAAQGEPNAPAAGRGKASRRRGKAGGK